MGKCGAAGSNKISIAVVIVLLSSFGFAQTVTLTQANLSEYLTRLRTTSKQDYIVEGAVYLKGIASASEDWHVQNITFKSGATICIGSTNLTLTVDGQLTTETNYGILFTAYPPNDAKAPAGASGGPGGLGPTSSSPGSAGGPGGRGFDGAPGQNGARAGNLTLRLKKLPNLSFKVSLVGQDGGDGGNGGQGGAGGTGQKGRPGDSGAFGCNRGGDNGGAGGRGGDGGNGGMGGFCGAGGLALILTPEAIATRMQDSIKIERPAASSGSPGRPGSGGPGGQGGQGGDGNGFCGGGGPGATGGSGNPGSVNATPSVECQVPTVQIVSY